MTSGTLIRQARTRAGLSQVELVAAQRQGSGADRPLGTRRRAAEPRDAPRTAPRLRIRRRAHARPVRARQQTRRAPAHEAGADSAGAAAGDAEANGGPDGGRRLRPVQAAAGTRAASGHLRHRRRSSAACSTARTSSPTVSTSSPRPRTRTCAGSGSPSTTWARVDPTAARWRWTPTSAARPILELQTDAGELKIVPEPAGTRGYDDLRRRARREPLGRGLRPSVASIDDHARMLAALDRAARPDRAPDRPPPDRARARAPPRSLDRTLTNAPSSPTRTAATSLDSKRDTDALAVQ